MFRFSNMLFEPIWNNQFIEKVEMKIYEKLDVQGRGAFYDSIGALRDVGQNHMLRMALIAMENPHTLEASAVRTERHKVMKSLQPIEGKDVKKFTVRGQYKGYRNEASVAKTPRPKPISDSKLFINNRCWKGVPFYLESGKAMKESKAEIQVYQRIRCTFLPKGWRCDFQNVITFKIQPEEGTSIRFWAKPGLVSTLEPRELAFSYNEEKAAKKPWTPMNAYCLTVAKGDQTFFTSTGRSLCFLKSRATGLSGPGKEGTASIRQGEPGSKK
ncbi:MAG: hypothetical protein U0519_03725 [Candidatus Gracilibacteria bacterium]